MTSHNIRKSCSPTQGDPDNSRDSLQREEGSNSSNEEDVVDTEKGKATTTDQEELIEIPPSVPKNGIAILAHKLWIGNLDKRLTE